MRRLPMSYAGNAYILPELRLKDNSVILSRFVYIARGSVELHRRLNVGPPL